MRYAVVKNNKIQTISSELFNYDQECQVIEIPNELSEVSATDLILNSKIKNGKIFYKYLSKPTAKMKIAFISNWKSACGIATYFENLLPEVIKHVGDYKLFVEDNPNSTGLLNQIGLDTVSSDKVLACWKRGESLLELTKAIKEYDPDIILINHEWGIFPDPKHWLSCLTQLSDYRVITIIHSTFPNHLDKTIVEASMPEIIVHLEQARACLRDEKNIGAKIHVIPHGCYLSNNATPLWNIYKTDHTFVQIGFGLRYKAFEDSIRAVFLLKEKYPDIFFTAIFSQNSFSKNEHEIYYQELISLINELNVNENVGIVRGFQSDNCIDSYFRTNKVAVFPYKSFGEHFVYGSSGATISLLSKGIPVITSLIPHFSDTPSIKAHSPEDIAHELDKLFSDNNLRLQQIEKQNQFIIDNSWEQIAKKYLAIFECDE